MVGGSDGGGEVLFEARSGCGKTRAHSGPELRFVEQQVGGHRGLADEVTERAGSTFAPLDVNELSTATEQVAGLDGGGPGSRMVCWSSRANPMA